MSGIRAVEVSELRANWSHELEAAAGGDVLVTGRRGAREVVLMPPDTWRDGRAVVAVNDSQCEELTSMQVRTGFRKVRQAVQRGAHVVVTVWGDVTGVLVPYEWARQVLPEIDLLESGAPSTPRS
ncbi:hypothetical protein OG225_43280 (plasmid) [Nocardia sp. NBC_01377]|uniref:hypothetical protein n=1 Tax=Nocardia sp. NBC_01377 TaxID=2903595 RepID=UPI002F91356C